MESYLDFAVLADSAEEVDDTEGLPPFFTTYVQACVPNNEQAIELLEFLPSQLSSHWPHVTPMPILGDGDCLLRAISYSMWGTQKYKNKLRALLVEELKEHMEWYKQTPAKVEGEDTNWDETLIHALTNNAYLGFSHVFALSNVLGRTIVVYANDTNTKHYGGSENGVTATFFPARKIAFHEEIEALPVIAISWGNEGRSHYISITSVETGFNWDFPPTAFERYLTVPDHELKAAIVNNHNIIAPPQHAPPPQQKKKQNKQILVQFNSADGNPQYGILQTNGNDDNEDNDNELYRQQQRILDLSRLQQQQSILQLQQHLNELKKQREQRMVNIIMRIKLHNKIYELQVKEDTSMEEDMRTANEFLENKQTPNKSVLTLFTKYISIAQKLVLTKKLNNSNKELYGVIGTMYQSSSNQSHLTQIISQLAARKSQHQLIPNFDKKYLLVSFLTVKFAPSANINSLSRAYEAISSNNSFSYVFPQQKAKFDKLYKNLSNFTFTPSSKSTGGIQLDDFQLLFDLLSHPSVDADILFPVMDVLRIAVLASNFTHFLNDTRVNNLYKIIYSASGKKYETFLYLSLMMISNLFHSESLIQICFEEKLSSVLFILDKSINFPTANPDKLYQFASKIILYLVSFSSLKSPNSNRLNKLRTLFFIVSFIQKIEVHIHYDVFYNLLQALGILLYHDPDLQKFLHDKVNLYYLLEEIERDLLRFINDAVKPNPASVPFYAQLYDLGNLIDEIYELLAYPTHVINLH